MSHPETASTAAITEELPRVMGRLMEKLLERGAVPMETSREVIASLHEVYTFGLRDGGMALRGLIPTPDLVRLVYQVGYDTARAEMGVVRPIEEGT